MKVIVLKAYGSPDEALEIREQEIPIPKSDELLIKVKAASINPIDCRMRAGYGKVIFSSRAPLPIVLGRDFSGVVVETGADVTNFKIGDAVWGIVNPFRIAGLKQGAHAEYICIPQSDCTKKPPNYDFVSCASIPYVALTTWSALIVKNGMFPTDYSGKKILVHAGAGGIGSFAIQFLKQLGAIVTTTCSAEKIEFCRFLGADRIIDYKKQNYSDLLHDLDVVYDLLGKQHTDLSLNVLTSAPCSSVIQESILQKLTQESMQDVECSDNNFDIAQYKDILKSFDQKANELISPKYDYVSIVGPMITKTDSKGFHSGMREFVLETLHKKFGQLKLHGRKFNYAVFEPNKEGLDYITKMVIEGKILPQVNQVFPIDAAIEAHKVIDAGRTRGKVVLTME